MRHDKHFSLDEANELLDEVRPILDEMVQLKSKLDVMGYDVFKHQYFGGLGPNGTGDLPQEMERLIEIVKDISSRGILIKGLDNGLIDFPHIRKNGEEVYLCWKSGEESISYWHRIEDGSAGRKNIEEL